MNAVVESHAHAPVAAPHATHKLKLLIKREYWENKGGFVWAPAIVGIIAMTFVLLAELALTIMSWGHRDEIRNHIDDVETTSRVLGAVGDGTFLGGIGLAMVVLSFVVFFYTLGSLYDDRRDRSILFWKSMPVSDTQMVLSKLAWSVLLAPLVAMAIGAVIGIGFWLITAVAGAINGVPGTGGMFVHSHPIRILGSILLALPVQIVWSLPTVGWLMLCSAWSRRLPFLWSTMVPILTGAILSFMDIFPGIDTPHKYVWYTIYRGLLSVVPGSWMPTVPLNADIDGAEDVPGLITQAIGQGWQVFTHADIWIGAVIGVAMIYGAIRLRRWREEG